MYITNNMTILSGEDIKALGPVKRTATLEYPVCEVGYSLYGRDGSVITATRENCLHCKEQTELWEMELEKEKRTLQNNKY